MSLDIKDIITKQIKSVLGDPVLASLPADLQGIDNAIELAQYEYWKSFPYVYAENGQTYFNDTSEKLVDISSIVDAATVDTDIADKPKAYYIGVLRFDTYNYNELFYNQGLDSYLLGVPFRNRTLPNNYEKYILNKTQLGMVQGGIDIRIDWINKKVRYTFPYAVLNYTVHHAIGFNDPDLKFIDYNKIYIFSKMVLEKFLEMVITVRSTLKLQGDYDVDVENLKSIRDRNREDLTRILERTTKLPMIL